MGASATALNQALDGLGGTVSGTNLLAYTAQNTGAPGSTGANEYASTTRQASTWNAASGSAKTNSSALTFTNSGTTPVTDLSTWSASTAGTFGIGLHLATPVTAATITVAAGALNVGGVAT